MKLKIALLVITTAIEATAFCTNTRPSLTFISKRTAKKNAQSRSCKNVPIGNLSALGAFRSGDDDDDNISFNQDNDFPMEELHERITQYRRRRANSYSDFLGEKMNDVDDNVDGKRAPYSVHVVLFNADTPNEGLHAIEYPRGSGKNSVLAFETKEECETFAKELGELHFFDPKSRKMKLSFLREHCESLGISLKLVPTGMELSPPMDRVDELMYNPMLAEMSVALEAVLNVGYTSEEKGHYLESEGVLVGGELGSWD